MAWDEDLLRRMAIAPKILPTVVDTAGDIAVTDPSWFGRAIPITSLVGDQQAALFGQGCFREGLAKCTIGTGAFVLAHAGSELPSATPELIRTVAWRQAGRKTVYAWEGAVFTAGSLINWLRDGLEIIERPEDTARIAAAVDDCGGVVMVPAFSGLATPYWDPAARGLLVGMTSKTTRAHVVRAALESIAMQIVDVLMSMEHASRAELASVQVDGGVAQNAVVLQSLADLSDRPIHRHAMAEATARGACWLAGLAAGLWSSEEVLPVDSWGETTRFQPHLGSSERAAQYHRWQQAVARSRGWADMPEAEAP
jgi:glycerol kinase